MAIESPDEMIRNYLNESEISVDSDVYKDLFAHLSEMGLNLAFLTFNSSRTSHCGRKMPDETSITCPVLNLYLKYDSDFQQTGIDPHSGNWGDAWSETLAVRDVLNGVLNRHDFSSSFLSEHTFIFFRFTREEIAFRQIGRFCKPDVKGLILAELPNVTVDHIYWIEKEYTVLLREKAQCKRVTDRIKSKIEKAMPSILAKADVKGYCMSYDVTIAVTHVRSLHLISEDCGE